MPTVVCGVLYCRHPPRPAAPDLCGQAAGGWPHPGRLQHPEGVHPAPGAAFARRLLEWPARRLEVVIGVSNAR